MRKWNVDVAMEHVLAVKEGPQLTDFVIKIPPFVYVNEVNAEVNASTRRLTSVN